MNRDRSIVTQAMMKSILPHHPAEEWEQLTKEALRIHDSMVPADAGGKNSPAPMPLALHKKGDEIAGFLQKQPKSTSPITSGIRIVKGVGQMRHDSGKPHSGALFDVSQNAEGVAILASPTSHTRVQFEMHREHNAESGRLELKIPDLIDRMGRKMKLPVCEQVHGGTASIELVDRHQDQDIRSSSRRGH